MSNDEEAIDKKLKKPPPINPLKALTGIEGFDVITRGGLTRGRTTLIEGGAGSGKTIMALQTLVNGARHDNEPGIFVAFEESSEQIKTDAAKFGWNLTSLEKKRLFFLNAQPTLDVVQSGGFELIGMLAALDAKVLEIGAKRIVFDAIDIVLALLNNPEAERREAYRLNEWLRAHRLTGIITSKKGTGNVKTAYESRFGFLEFMVDCSVILNHEIIDGVSQRNLRVAKNRGSAFSENESPFIISGNGIEVAVVHKDTRPTGRSTMERISSGVQRLDTMLGGGYYRSASILITGVPGTAKTTLSGAFAEAACERGERTIFISFDSDANDVVRNVASVNIRLNRFISNGLLKVVSARALEVSAEIHLMQIRNLVAEFKARCVVIDPLSALFKAGNLGTAHSVAERLIEWAKTSGVTLLCTSLLDGAGTDLEATPLQISTVADTWIHLNYLVQSGERNRGLSIIKSRGTEHSNQVRELILSDTGVTLADAYTGGGEVLMGTLRWEREVANRAAREDLDAQKTLDQVTFENEETELESRLKVLERQLIAKRAMNQTRIRRLNGHVAKQSSEGSRLQELRGANEK